MAPRAIASAAAGLAAAVLVAACGSTTPSPSSTVGASEAVASTATAAATLPPGGVPSATPNGTPIPGFAGWTILTPGAVSISVEPNAFGVQDSLLMTLTHKALWFQSRRGVLFSTPASGDFRVSATVGTARTSDMSKTPGGDGTIQFAGLMARAEGVTENYVFIVIGGYTTGLAIETKSTRDNVSHFEDTTSATGLAQLKLCRIGYTFTLASRPIENGDWTVMATYDRPDLDGSLDVGANIYSDSTPDITARFKHLTIEPLTAGATC